MAKRSAAVQLTADNCDQEDEQDEGPGEFAKASEEELKKRAFKKAKRTMPSGKASTNPLAQLKLLNTSALPPPPPNAFIQLVHADTKPNPLHKLTPPSQPSAGRKESLRYLAKLKELNTSVTEWISEHVKKNVYVDLTPIFEDYRKYLNEIEKEHDVKTDKENVSETVSSEKVASEEEEDEGTADEEMTDPESTSQQQESSKDDQSKESEGPSVSLNIGGSSNEAADDSLLNIRCKLFYKKETEFAELGVGNLRVTSGENGGVCLLLRNDTAMKKVLLNVRLSKGIPLSLQKNKLLLVCLPNPPLNVKSDDGKSSDQSTEPAEPVKPVTYLLRVKDEQGAKNLHSTITSNL